MHVDDVKEMHVCKLSFGLEKLKFDKIMPMLSAIGSRLVRLRRHVDSLGKLVCSREASVALGDVLLFASHPPACILYSTDATLTMNHSFV